MRALCLILTLLSSPAWANTRQVICLGKVQARQSVKSVIDTGVARVRFHLVDRSIIKNIDVASKFRKLPSQSIEAYESRAVKRAVASGRYRADLFNIGHNGACQMALGYQADLIAKVGAQSSWGVFAMNCGTHAVIGNLKCQMK